MWRSIKALFTVLGIGGSKQPSQVAVPDMKPFDIVIPDEIDVLRHIYKHISDAIRPGIETAQIELLVGDLLKQTEAEGYFKGYRGFPNFISASINNEVLMTLPSSRRLQEGDLFSIQTGVKFGDRYAYVGWTFPVGSVSPTRKNLISTGQRSLEAGLSKIKDGARVSEVTKAMDTIIRAAGYSPNADFVGYQIGLQASMAPQIPCSYSSRATTAELKAGMTLAIIVILHEGSANCSIAQDGWSVITTDGSDSVLFSRLVRVETGGCTVLSDFPITKND
jgi:methionyl aminopeptidase